MARHSWQLSSVIDEKTIYVVAACDRCGLSRAAVSGRGITDRHVNLAGECPGDSPPQPAAVMPEGPLLRGARRRSSP